MDYWYDMLAVYIWVPVYLRQNAKELLQKLVQTFVLDQQVVKFPMLSDGYGTFFRTFYKKDDARSDTVVTRSGYNQRYSSTNSTITQFVFAPPIHREHK